MHIGKEGLLLTFRSFSFRNKYDSIPYTNRIAIKRSIDDYIAALRNVLLMLLPVYRIDIRKAMHAVLALSQHYLYFSIPIKDWIVKLS
jgi:hypothetical protein